MSWDELADDTITTADMLEDETHDLRVFQTSGTTGHPKRIPYSRADQDQLITATAQAFRHAGITADDRVLNLGAPRTNNHISAWIYTEGANAIGATVLNESFDDYMDAPLEETTTILATPLILRAAGNRIDAAYGLKETLPDAEKAVTAGDLLPEHLREQLIDQWDLSYIRDAYAFTEAGIVAIEDSDDDGMVPVNDELQIEILSPDDGYDPSTGLDAIDIDDLYDITTIEQPVSGPALVSAPERDALPIRRYLGGDTLRAWPADDGPRISFMGRIDDTVSLGGAPLYAAQIDKALSETHASIYQDWRAVYSHPSGSTPAIDIYLIGCDTEPDTAQFLYDLFERSTPVKEAYSFGRDIVYDHATRKLRPIDTQQDEQIIAHIDLETVEDIDGFVSETGYSPEDGSKADRIYLQD